jgi:beta-ribofuranosylaminobenzene 5'-phosphate synthase
VTAAPRVTVSAPSRLHLGLIDPTGILGRRFGSIGVAIAPPLTTLVVEATGEDDLTALAPPLAARLSPDDVLALERRLAELVVRHRLGGLPAPRAARLLLESAPRAHAGFGSGTQLALAVGTALAHLAGHAVDPALVGRALERGRRSGIGLAAFARGGLVVDGGHPVEEEEPEAGAPAPGVPPLLARHPLPDAWRFVLVVPDRPRGLSGDPERAAFRRLPRGSPDRVREICQLVLLRLLPAAVEGDLARFGEALTLVQRLAGDELAPLQGGRFATPLVAAAVAALLDAGADGAGQSSWGPACYGVVGSEAEAAALAARMRDWLAERGASAEVFVARPDNDGARVAAQGADGP